MEAGSNPQLEEKALSKGRQWVSALVVAFGGAGLGLSLAWTATALPSIQETGQVKTRRELDPVEKSLIASVYFCGALFSCPLSAWSMGTIGKKACLIWLAILGTSGWIMMAMATTVEHLYVGRILTGIYSGGCTVIVPVYVKELASKENRGVLGSLFSVMLSIGKLTSNSVGILVPASTLSLLCALQPIAHAALLFLIPESPLPLLAKYPTTLVIASDAIHKNTQTTGNYKPRTTKALWLPITTVFTLALLCQFCGINVVTFFTNEMFRGIFKGDNSILNPQTIMVILAALQVAGALPVCVLVDRCGRKALLLSSLGVMTISMAVLSAFYYYSITSDQNAIPEWGSRVVPLVFLVAYSVAHNWGVGSVIWIVMAEITPSEISAVISSLASATYWSSAFLVTLVFQLYVDEVPLHTWFLVFSLVTLAGFGFVMRYLPETKGLGLQEIQDFYSKSGRKTTDQIKSDR